MHPDMLKSMHRSPTSRTLTGTAITLSQASGSMMFRSLRMERSRQALRAIASKAGSTVLLTPRLLALSSSPMWSARLAQSGSAAHKTAIVAFLSEGRFAASRALRTVSPDWLASFSSSRLPRAGLTMLCALGDPEVVAISTKGVNHDIEREEGIRQISGSDEDDRGDGHEDSVTGYARDLSGQRLRSRDALPPCTASAVRRRGPVLGGVVDRAKHGRMQECRSSKARRSTTWQQGLCGREIASPCTAGILIPCNGKGQPVSWPSRIIQEDVVHAGN